MSFNQADIAGKIMLGLPLEINQYRGPKSLEQFHKNSVATKVIFNY